MNFTETLKNKLGKKAVEIKSHNDRRIYISVKSPDLKECAEILFKDMDGRYIVASGADNIDNFEILYHFGFDKEGVIVSLRVFLDRENPQIDSLTGIIPGISYIEREMWELLGIDFRGHPGLKHFLLRDDWPEEVYPLRKNIKTGGESCEQ